MRYERRSVDQDLAGVPRRRIAILVIVVLLLAGGTIGAVLATSSTDPPPSVTDRSAIEPAFVSANIFLENIGSPPPLGVSDARWALRSVPLIGSGFSAHLGEREHGWLFDGAIVLLSPSQAQRLAMAQTTLINALFAGSLRRQVLAELHQITDGEQHSTAKIASPGGAKVTQWISVTERGDRATAEAVVSERVQQDSISGNATNARINSTIILGDIDSIATLRRVDGSWRLTTLRQPPFQQAT